MEQMLLIEDKLIDLRNAYKERGQSDKNVAQAAAECEALRAENEQLETTGTGAE
jgi:hypothetical protein